MSNPSDEQSPRRRRLSRGQIAAGGGVALLITGAALLPNILKSDKKDGFEIKHYKNLGAQEILTQKVADPFAADVRFRNGQTSWQFSDYGGKEVAVNVAFTKKAASAKFPGYEELNVNNVSSVEATVFDRQQVQQRVSLYRLSDGSFGVTCVAPDSTIYESSPNPHGGGKGGPGPNGEEPKIKIGAKEAAECAATITADVLAMARYS
ncbi:MAG TPA: hypothetical protein VLG37_04535 [Candidatus Saccharimonadales bacterium]|nr:hypothetical protein [Candidatus Saccharimonadales bacterium]